MKINFFGDGLWAVNTLRELQRADHEITAVIMRASPSEKTLEKLATECNIPVRQPQNVNAPDFVQWIRDLEAALSLSVSYDQIVREPLRQTATHGFINCHAGNLPEYRGRNVINWALLNGEEEIGVTVHYMDDGIDTGDIITQRQVPINWEDDYGSVLRKLHHVIPTVVTEAVSIIATGDVDPICQSHEMGTYFSRRLPGDEWLDWSKTSEALYHKVRAIARPAPGAITTLDDRELVIWGARYERNWPNYTATIGEVVGLEDDGVRVKTGDSTLVLTEVQYREEKAPFVPRFRIGTRFGLNHLDELHSLRQEVQQLQKLVGRLTDELQQA